MVKAIIKFLFNEFFSEESFNKTITGCYEEYLKRKTRKK